MEAAVNHVAGTTLVRRRRAAGPGEGGVRWSITINQTACLTLCDWASIWDFCCPERGRR
jgi:hypothetical protein